MLQYVAVHCISSHYITIQCITLLFLQYMTLRYTTLHYIRIQYASLHVITITIWLFNIAMENHHFLIGKPSINGPFSMAMLNNQRVHYTT